MRAKHFYIWVCIAPNRYKSYPVKMYEAGEILDAFSDEEHKYGFYDTDSGSLFIGKSS